MSFKIVKGWTLVAISLLLMAAATVLLIANAGMPGVVHLYSKDVQVNIGLLMLLSAVGGIVLMWMVVLLRIGISSIRAANRAKADEPRQDASAPSSQAKGPEGQA